MLLSVLLALLVLPLGCAAQQPTVSFSDLVNNPQRYNGQTVTVDAFYFAGFEIQALAGSLAPASYNPANFNPQPPLIWLSKGIGTEPLNQLYKQQTTPSGYAETYGKVQVRGVFAYGGRYGHLDAYQYALSVIEARVLPWQTDSPATLP